MLPWTHAAVGYLLLVSLAVVLGHRLSRAELLAVLVGTQLADVLDKPLAWWFGALPSGRSLFHSLLVAAPLSVVLLAVAWYYHHSEVGVAFALGYLSHLVGDTYVAIYYWRPAELTFLFWPALPPYPYDDFAGLLDFVTRLTVTRPLLAVFGLSAVVGLLFLVHFLRLPWLGTSGGW
jgi:hypothetical protein